MRSEPDTTEAGEPPGPERSSSGRSTATAVDDGPSNRIAAATSTNRFGSARHARIAALVFAAYLAFALVYLLVTFDDRFWFIGDDWGMLVERSIGDPVGWFAPQNTHWSTVPTLVYQLLYQVFGLNSYLPYAGAVVVAHLGLAALLRLVMRRAGVGPWVATVVAGTYVLYGTGQQNIWFAIQISMVVSMLAGVGHLVLADHDGALDRRDALGLLLGLVGLMASGVGPPLVAAVGLAVLVRRGWRLALVHTVPLAAVFAIWWAWQEPGAADAMGADLGSVAAFVWSGAVGTFEGMGQWSGVALLLAGVAVGGAALAWGPLRGAALRRAVAVPLAMVVGAVLVLASAGSQRYLLGAEFARSSRYVAMATALVLPVVAVGASAIVDRWKYSAPVVALVVVAGVPGNIAALGTVDEGAARRYRAQQEFLLGAVSSPLAEQVPPETLPYPGEGVHQVPIGFLLEARRSGRLPDPPPLDDAVPAKIDTRLALSQSEFGAQLADERCRSSREPIVVSPAAGDQFAFDGPINVERSTDGGTTFQGRTSYSSQWSGRVLTAQLDGQTFRIGPVGAATAFTWCEPG